MYYPKEMPSRKRIVDANTRCATNEPRRAVVATGPMSGASELVSRVLCVVPDCLASGDTFVVEVNGHEWTVDVPDGAYAGQEIELDLPLEKTMETAEDGRLVVTVPEQCGPGDRFLVETTSPTGEAFSFETIVPDACYPGHEIIVIVPQMLEAPSSPPWFPYDEYEPACETPTGKADRRSCVQDPLLDPERAALRRTRVGAFSTIQRLEVERNDGSWSRGHVEDYDELGDTYTVRLIGDGRVKYFVERASLRVERVGGLAHGQAVSFAACGGDGLPYKSYAAVDEYDAESGLYTLLLVSSGRYRLACDDEIEAIDFASL